MKKKPQTSWGNVADWYNKLLEESPDTYQSQVILPNLLRLITPRSGETILDIACGQGFFSRAFHGAGATVFGMDIAAPLIALAKKRSPKAIWYQVAAADQMPSIVSESIDTATIVLALQNIENLAGVVAETARVLKPSGRFVIVLNHPAFRIPGRTSWGWDETTKTQYRRVDAYLSDARAKIEMHPGLARRSGGAATDDAITISFHRPLQVYAKALAKHGFAITRLEEWTSHRQSQPGPHAHEEDRLRKEIPLFLCLEARQTTSRKEYNKE